MYSAHCSANCVSCGVALREAKNATNRLSSKSLFPDKSIKKAQATALTYPVLRPWLPTKRISNTDSPRRRYIAYTEPIGDGDIHQTRTSDCESSCQFKPPSLGTEDFDNKMSTNMYGSTAKAISHYKDIENFWESVNLCKNSCVEICYLCTMSPNLGCTHSGFLTGWIASGEKKFQLFLFFC